MQTTNRAQRLWLPLASMLLLGACSEAPSQEEAYSETEVRLNGPLTTTSTVAALTANDSVGIRMCDASGNTVESYANLLYTSNALGALTATDTKMYYPIGSAVGFTAYAPYCASLLSGTDLPIDLTDQLHPKSLDILYAATGTSYNKSETSIPLSFSHIMSILRLKTVAGVGLTATDLAGMQVKIIGLSSSATFHTHTGTLTLSGFQDTITLRTRTDGSLYEAILAPSYVLAQRVEIKFNVGGNSYTWVMPEMILAPNTINEWTLTISRTNVTITNSDIFPWIIQDIISGTSDLIYKVGDYYPYPQDRSTAKGIVFSVSDGGLHGLALSGTDGVTNGQGVLIYDPGDGSRALTINEYQTLYEAWNSKPYHGVGDGDGSTAGEQQARTYFNQRLQSLPSAAHLPIQTGPYWATTPFISNYGYEFDFGNPSQYNGIVTPVNELGGCRYLWEF